ncbi:hypothetical protein [Niastella sp.]|uniref:hypothetical protein n=1 Tax=Niastella sp. TaxID=1869183 RepID=UPI00389A6271
MRKKIRCRVFIDLLWRPAQSAPAFAKPKTISGIISDKSEGSLEKLPYLFLKKNNRAWLG